ncbi:hypothetical protein LTR78_001391 [Recurvomyces mirabilis]|uniref:Uncharacterized protein n=1 Tax=Recurvomyces mirabilis TaxID=574656 RepID=A0AAE0WVI6_9PEZI|nr:hypothetical protein LTR78_001391 [Recurvomyces mirabilis]KAK5161368.1 hypothetical protein LTS14_001164 [Recurvomyces mirabilis]
MAMALEGDRMMLVYEQKTSGIKLVPDGVALVDEMELIMAMSKDPSVYLVTKTIQPGQTYIDLYKSDLVRDGDQMSKSADDCEKKVAETPWRAWLGFEWEGHSFTELSILTIAPNHAVA